MTIFAYFSYVKVLDIRDELPSKFLNFKTGYNDLDDEEVNKLLSVCRLVSPDKLNGQCIFEKDSLPGDSSNKMYELSAASSSMMVADTIVVSRKHVKVNKIMEYLGSWRRKNYDQPMATLRASTRSSVTVQCIQS